MNYSTKQYNDVPQAHEDDLERQQKTADDGAALIVTTVVIICMAISFLIARQLCCFQSNPSDITCGMACSNSAPPCRYCATMEDIREQFDYELPPCCTITICYLCFRGLPVILVLFLTPLLAFILLTFLLPTEDAKTPGFFRCFQCSTRLRYQSLNPTKRPPLLPPRGRYDKTSLIHADNCHRKAPFYYQIWYPSSLGDLVCNQL